MNKVTEIKEWQVWLAKNGEKKPIMVSTTVDNWIFYRWYRKDGVRVNEEKTMKQFCAEFAFDSSNVSEEDFQKWCMTGKRPL